PRRVVSARRLRSEVSGCTSQTQRLASAASQRTHGLLGSLLVYRNDAVLTYRKPVCSTLHERMPLMVLLSVLSGGKTKSSGRVSGTQGDGVATGGQVGKKAGQAKRIAWWGGGLILFLATLAWATR